MAKISSRLSIRVTFFIISGIMVLQAALAIDSAWSLKALQQDDAATINVAGRQRMLSQKAGKEAFLTMSLPLGSEARSAQQQSLENTLALFERSLKALISGGQTTTILNAKDQTKLVTMAKPSPEGSAALQKVNAIWQEYQAVIQEGVSAQDLAAMPGLRDKINGVSLKLLKEMHATVGLIAGESRARKHAAVDAAYYVSIVVVFLGLVLILALVLFNEGLNGQIRVINSYLDQLAIGDLRSDLRTTFSHELNTIVLKINDMAKQMGWLLRTIALHSQSVKSVVGEMVPLKSSLFEDAERSKTLVQEVTLENDKLDSEIQQLNGHVNNARQSIEEGNKSSRLLAGKVSGIAESAEQASINVNTMASAAEQMTSNLSQVNQSLEVTSESVQNVSQAVEALNMSLDEVRQRCQSADKLSGEATQNASNTQAVMEKLTELVFEIGKSAKQIKNIADQTNMLALNAAIEAAGAGEAGKGFGVVANEVKELAAQTAEATKSIESQISAIQDESSQAQSANQSVVDVISQLAGTNRAITDSVDDQAAGVSEIAESIQTVRQSAQEVTRNANELSAAAEAVARVAMDAATSTAEIASTATDVAQLASNVANLSDEAQQRAANVELGAGEIYRASIVVQKKMIESLELSHFLHGSIEHSGFLTDVIDESSHALSDTERGFLIPAPPFNVSEAKGWHLEWLGKLEDVIRGRQSLLPEEVTSSRECKFGNWLYGAGQESLGEMKLFQEVVDVHNRIHEKAKEVVRLAAHDDPDDAIQAMSHFAALRRELFEKLDQLYVSTMSQEGDVERDFMPWNDHLATGIKAMDAEHKVLVKLINDVYRLMVSGETGPKAHAVLDELASYTVNHFKHEEEIMSQHKYPVLPGHAKLHVDLTDQVLAFIKAVKAGEANIDLGLMSFLKDWLTTHIIVQDKKYGEYILEGKQP
ncbi:putative methyl-accepting chemotaxis sensory transducer [Magnetofaba australis IT-1]|uniref:Putative methyl-accepting chemotaxis sensory transducer n=2 Tax=Magnetofaba TaxID=1472292 RepID=A0A1Y2K8R6_9PROT|nr:putative methyl-accepting chemotaxis sensory transducer [Magnetofaba australis IT-1]